MNDTSWLKDQEVVYNQIKLPVRGTKNSAGYDIFSPVDILLYPNQSMKVPTGLKAYMLPSEYIMIVPRSSMGFKFFMRLANTVAVGDSDYYNNKDNEIEIFGNDYNCEKFQDLLKCPYHLYLI